MNPPDASVLLRRHHEMLARLPVTFRAFIGVEAGRWPTLFAAEKAYLGALLDSLARPADLALRELFAGVTRVETEAGCRDLRAGDAREVQDAAQALLRRKGLLPRWRQEIDQVFQSLQPGEDIKILLASLVVVIVGGMGSITGAALGAVLIGLAEQFGSVYMPTYAVVLTFVIMVVVLAVRPQGLLRGY